MKRLVAMAGVGLLFLGTPARGAGLAAQAPVFNFGLAEQGTTVVHQFALDRKSTRLNSSH